MEEQKDLIVKQVLEAWNGQLNRANKFLNAHSDEELLQEVSPGRNSGIYLIGHLTAIHDALLPLLGFGERLFPDLEPVFVKNPDRSGLEKPAVRYVRDCWNQVNEALYHRFHALSTEEWLQKHEAVSAEDFVKEPHRNRLNVVISRTGHLAYHLGQLALIGN
jgi:hypothetical protein